MFTIFLKVKNIKNKKIEKNQKLKKRIFDKKSKVTKVKKKTYKLNKNKGKTVY